MINIEVSKESLDDDKPLSAETIQQARDCEKEYKNHPERFTQLVK